MKKIIEKIKSLKTGTLVRTALQILAYINQIVAIAGNYSFAKDQPWYMWVSLALTIVVTVLSYWYNNDWTKLAQTTGDIYDMVKDGKITKEELDEFVEKHNHSEE